MLRPRANTIHSRLVVSTIGLVCLSVLIGLSTDSFLSLIRLNREIRHYTHTQVPGTLKLLNLDRDFYQAQWALEQAAQEDDSAIRHRLIQEHRLNRDQVHERYAAFTTLIAPAPGEQHVREQFAHLFESWRVNAIRAAARIEDGADAAHIHEIIKHTRTQFTQARNRIDLLEESYHEPITLGAQASLAEEHETVRAIVLTTAALGVGLILALYNIIAISRQQRALERSNEQTERQNRAREFENRVNESLSMTRTEAMALQMMTEAVEELGLEGRVDVMLADSSQAHMRLATTTDPTADGPACTVKSPHDCPAVRAGHELSFPTSSCFSACPYLRRRPEGGCSASCVPINTMGRAVGVLHAICPNGHPPDSLQVEQLTMITSKLSERIGLLRAYEQSRTQASTDALTGLFNRRSLEQHIQSLQESGHGYAVAYGDLDRFKKLNDTHGHETGDRALRMFSRVLRESLRPSDIVGRWGGEEFVVLLPSLTAEQAATAIERVRERLAEVVSSGNNPHFTASFGIAHCSQADQFAEVLALADAALLEAKEAGRDRVVISQEMDRSFEATSGNELDHLFEADPDEGMPHGIPIEPDPRQPQDAED